MKGKQLAFLYSVVDVIKWCFYNINGLNDSITKVSHHTTTIYILIIDGIAHTNSIIINVINFLF